MLNRNLGEGVIYDALWPFLLNCLLVVDGKGGKVLKAGGEKKIYFVFVFLFILLYVLNWIARTAGDP